MMISSALGGRDLVPKEKKRGLRSFPDFKLLSKTKDLK
jgi:hypothetical protein